MIKKEYLQPAIRVCETETEEQLLAGSVTATGLSDDNLTQDETPGDSWNEAMSRRNVWNGNEEE